MLFLLPVVLVCILIIVALVVDAKGYRPETSYNYYNKIKDDAKIIPNGYYKGYREYERDAIPIIDGIINGDNPLFMEYVRRIKKLMDDDGVKCLGPDALDDMKVSDYIPNYSHNCFSNVSDNMTTAVYQFKANTKDIVTTEYVRSLKEINNVRYVMMLIDYFNSMAKLYTNQYNLKHGNIIPDKTFVVLYKGGNVINMYVKLFLHKLGSKVSDIEEKMRKEMNRGDWDFTLSIDTVKFNTIPNNKLVFEQIKTVMLFALSEIQREIERHLRFDYRAIADRLYNILKSNDILDIVSNISRNNNVQLSARVDNIVVPHYEIDSKGVYPSNADMSKQSSIVTTTPNNADFYNVPSVVINKPSVSLTYITEIENLKFLKGQFISNFDLARVKIRNKSTVDINGNKGQLELPAELIDLTFVRPYSDENKALYVHRLVHEKGDEDITYFMYKVDGKDISLPFYTVQHLYFDLYSLLHAEALFMWNDRKYGKRLKRFITLGVICSSTKIDMNSILNI